MICFRKNMHVLTKESTSAHICTVKLGYSNIGFCDTLSIASNIQLYALIPHKATVFDIRL
jgi:hypothetical protein